MESWLLWFRLQLPGVKHLSLAPGPYALVETLCAPVAGWELLWDMTWPILLTPASLFALLVGPPSVKLGPGGVEDMAKSFGCCVSTACMRT